MIFSLVQWLRSLSRVPTDAADAATSLDARSEPPKGSAAPKLQTGKAGGVIARVLSGLQDASGRDSHKALLGQTDASRVAPATTDRSQAAGSQVSLRVGQAEQRPIHPLRDAYPTDAAFDEAYLRYQDQQMAALAKRYPKAVVRCELFHGSDFPPEVVLKSGLPMKGDGDNFDLDAHQHDHSDPNDPRKGSALRGACLDCRFPGRITGEGGYIYCFVPRGGGVSLCDALQFKEFIPGETEISFGARQPACQIKGYYRIGSYIDDADAYRLGDFVPNPDFNPAKV